MEEQHIKNNKRKMSTKNSIFSKIIKDFSKKRKTELPCDPPIPLWGIIQRKGITKIRYIG